MAVAVIGDHVPCAEPGARVVATTAAWGGAIGSLEVTLVVVFANLVNHEWKVIIHRGVVNKGSMNHLTHYGTIAGTSGRIDGHPGGVLRVAGHVCLT